MSVLAEWRILHTNKSSVWTHQRRTGNGRWCRRMCTSCPFDHSIRSALILLLRGKCIGSIFFFFVETVLLAQLEILVTQRPNSSCELTGARERWRFSSSIWKPLGKHTNMYVCEKFSVNALLYVHDIETNSSCRMIWWNVKAGILAIVGAQVWLRSVCSIIS